MENNLDNLCPQCGLPRVIGDPVILQASCKCGELDEIFEESHAIMTICAACGRPVGSSESEGGWQSVLSTNQCDCSRPQAIEDSALNFILQKKHEGFFEKIQETISASELEGLDLDSTRYQPTAELGRGGAGKIFLCMDKRMDKLVAVKVLHKLTDEQLVSFQREAKATSQLKHPSIVEILDFGATASGTPYMVMGYLEGISLQEVIAFLGALEPETALSITTMIAGALAYAHSQGIYHRDIKPANIVLCVEKDFTDEKLHLAVKVIDFGIAKVAEATGFHSKYQGKTLVGTPAYMPPDTVLARDYNAASEVYSLGCVLFEMLTGHKVFESDSSLEVMTAHTKESPPRLKDKCERPFTEALEEVVATCLEKNQEQRYSTMKELISAVEGVEPVEHKSGDDTSSDETESDLLESVDENEETTDKKLSPLLTSLAVSIAIVLGTTIGILLFPFQDKETQKPAGKNSSNEPEKHYIPKVKQAVPCTSKSCKQARAYLEQKKYDLAVRFFRRGLSENPKCALAYRDMARARYKKGEKSEALKELNVAIALDPYDAENFLLRGEIYKDEEDAGKAYEDADRAVKLNPRLAKAYLLRASSRFYISSYEGTTNQTQVIKDLDKVIELDPTLYKAWISKGVFLASIDKVPEAIKCFTRAIEVDPDQDDAYLDRSAAYSHLGKHDLATKDLEVVAKQKPYDSKPVKLIAAILEQQGKLKEAYRYYSKAIELDKGHKYTLLGNRAKISIKLRNYREAIEDFNLILKSHPLDEDSIKHRGDAYFELGQYEKALADYNEALGIYDNSPGTLKARARVLRKLGKLEKAEEDLKKAKSLEKVPAVKKI